MSDAYLENSVVPSEHIYVQGARLHTFVGQEVVPAGVGHVLGGGDPVLNWSRLHAFPPLPAPPYVRRFNAQKWALLTVTKMDRSEWQDNVVNGVPLNHLQAKGENWAQSRLLTNLMLKKASRAQEYIDDHYSMLKQKAPMYVRALKGVSFLLFTQVVDYPSNGIWDGKEGIP